MAMGQFYFVCLILMGRSFFHSVYAQISFCDTQVTGQLLKVFTGTMERKAELKKFTNMGPWRSLVVFG